MEEKVITKKDRVRDWHEKCCNQCKHKFTKYKGKQYQCNFSKCTDEEVLKFNKGNGCQGVREYLETGVFPERARKNRRLIMKELKPFDKCLVRNNPIGLWIPALYGAKSADGRYITSAGWQTECVPYEGNEHLLGTQNKCEL